MKIKSKEIIQIGDVSADRRLRLDSMVNILQEMAILHTQKVGIGLNSLLDSGKTWVLNRMAVEIDRHPQLDEEIEIHTWSRSIKRFRGVRDYELRVGGKPIATASTLWLYIDIEKRRPVRAPKEYESLYGRVDTEATSVNLEEWKAPDIEDVDYTLLVTTRLSDYDVNGHVNNAVILQYIETAVSRALGDNFKIQHITLSFFQEIPFGVDEVYVAVSIKKNGCVFQVESGAVVFARGVVEVVKHSDVRRS